MMFYDRIYAFCKAMMRAVCVYSMVLLIPVYGAVDLTLQKSVDNPMPLPGETIIYFVQVSTADEPRFGIMIEDMLPSGVTFVSSNSSQGTYNAGTGLWNVGNLPANTTALLAIFATVGNVAGQTIVNDAVIIDVVGDPYGLDCYGVDSCFASASIMPQPFCVITNIMVQDVLPGELTLLEAQTSQGMYDPYTGIWNVGTFDNSVQSATLTLKTEAKSNTGGLTITNCAMILDPYNDDIYTENNTACATVQIESENFIQRGGFLFWECTSTIQSGDINLA